MKKVYAGTLLTESAILASQLVLYKLAARSLGREGFSEYALGRRAIGLLLPAALCGLNVAIPRYVGLAHGEGRLSSSKAYFAGGLLGFGLASAVTLLCLTVFKDAFAYLFFGSSLYAYLILPVALMLLGSTLHVASYSYFRGHLNMARANLLQFANMAVVPLAVFPWARNSASFLFCAIGTATAVVGAGALLGIRFAVPGGDALRAVKEMLTFGLGRVPADFIQLAFLACPSIFVAHLAGIRPAGLVAFATSFLIMAASLFVAAGGVLLPETSQMIGRGDIRGLRERIVQMLVVTFVSLVIGTLVVEAAAHALVVGFLGSSFADGVGIVRIVALAALPYSLYAGLKTVIDASSARAINARNNCIAFAVFLLGCGFVVLRLADVRYILTCFVLGLYVLGGLTVREVLEVCRKTPDELRSRASRPVIPAVQGNLETGI
jgi:O-antigen/teichoic acid export membrane protein